MVPPRQEVCGVSAVSQREVPHAGDLPGLVRSDLSWVQSARVTTWDFDECLRMVFRWASHAVTSFQFCCFVGVEFSGRVDIPIQPINIF